MNEEERKVLKEAYDERYKKATLYASKKEEYSKLLDDPNVKRFLNLKDELDTIEARTYTIKDIDLKIIDYARSKVRISEPCNIYFYEGTYMFSNYTYSNAMDIEHGAKDIPVSRYDKRASYVMYINLEDFFVEKNIRIRDTAKFEEEHRIIYIKSHDKMYDVQREYFSLVISEGIEQAQRIICEKYPYTH